MRCPVLLALLVGCGAPAAAQSVGHDLEDGVKDIKYIFGAPLRIDRDALPRLGVVAGGTGLIMLLDEPLYDWIERHPEALPLHLLWPFRERGPLNVLGRTWLLLASSGVLYTAGQIADSRALQEAGLGCAASAGAATLSRGVLNKVIGRLRPRYGRGAFVFQPFALNDWEMRSFPAGHAAHVMSCVSFWNNHFDLGAGEPALFLLALGVGWARFADGAHWASDTAFSEVYGWAIGEGVAGRWRDRTLHRRQPALVIGGRFTF